MAGSLSLGGKIIATHTGPKGAGTVSLGTVSLDSNVTGSPNIDVVTNTGSGFRPAEVWLSTTQISTADTTVTLPTGYKKYRLQGSGIFTTSGAASTYGDIRLYFAQNDGTEDTNVRWGHHYEQLNGSGNGRSNGQGYAQLTNNQGVDATDHGSFDVILDSLTVLGRIRGYSGVYRSAFAHQGNSHYSQHGGFASDATTVHNKLIIKLIPDTGTYTGYGGELVLTGFTR